MADIHSLTPNIVNDVVLWPITAFRDIQYMLDSATAFPYSWYIPLVAAVGTAYYVGGGLPGQGQSLATHARAYALGGVAWYGTKLAVVDDMGGIDEFSLFQSKSKKYKHTWRPESTADAAELEMAAEIRKQGRMVFKRQMDLLLGKGSAKNAGLTMAAQHRQKVKDDLQKFIGSHGGHLQ